MIGTYEDYISMPRAMSATNMASIHRQMVEEIDCLLDAIELYNELIEAAIKYAEIRAKWAIMDREQKIEKDSYIIIHPYSINCQYMEDLFRILRLILV